MRADVVAWHDLECGGYTADLPLWRELAAEADGPILDVGAGTGRVALDLARAGHELIALDSEAAVLSVLEERAADLRVRTVHADARDFELGEELALVLAPMQTVQLLGGAEGRARFLARVAVHLRRGGLLAAALATDLQAFGPSDPLPAPDAAGGLTSQPVALRAGPTAWTIERVRCQGGEEARDEISLDRVSAAGLEAEGARHGLLPRPRRRIPATAEHLGAQVVVLARA